MFSCDFSGPPTYQQTWKIAVKWSRMCMCVLCVDDAERESKLQRRTSYLMATGRQHHLDGSCLSSLINSSLAAMPSVSSASSNLIQTTPDPTG